MLGIGEAAYLTKDLNGIETRFNVLPLQIKAGEFDCHNQSNGKPCIFGNLESNRIVVVYGDSHAGHLTNALNTAVGKEYKIFFFGENCFLSEVGNSRPECKLRIAEMEKLGNQNIYAVIRAQRWISYTQANKNAIQEAIGDAIKTYGLKPEKIIIAGSTEEINSVCEFANYYVTRRKRLCEINQMSKDYNKLFDLTTKNMNVQKNVFFVYPYEKICPNDICTPINGSVSNYTDNHHLTEDGAMLVMPDIIRILNN